MQPQDFIRRPLQYTKRHGIRATVSRLGHSFKRTLAGRWHVLFFCDLAAGPVLADRLPDKASVERKDAERELSDEDAAQIISVWNPKIARRQLSERFAQGASLWLFKVEGKVAAYGWTIIGRTVEQHFLPLGPGDAHLFDYFVFPEYRGQRINPALVNFILARLVSEGKRRAFIEAAEWNTAQLSSLSRTPFRPLGRAWKLSCFGKTLVIWSDREKPA